MRLILKQDVHNLGDAGEIVQVSGGYGRNYLVPRGLAIPASDGSVAALEHEQRIAAAIRRRTLADAQAKAAQLTDVAVTIRKEASDEDERLFGSVTSRDIVAALAEDGIELDRKTLQLSEPIRKIGMYTVDVRLHREVSASVRIYVTRA